MSNNIVETLVGAVVLAAAASFFFYTYNRVEVGTVDGYQLVASFDRIDGLQVGSDVRMSGIKVGTVIGQTLDLETYQARVTFNVVNNLKLPTDSSAEVASEGLLGGNYLSLSAGAMDEYLEDGDEVEFTQGALDLFGLIGQAVFSATDDNDDDPKK